MAADTSQGFEKFCGGKAWNASLSWYTDHPDFTECFKKTVLVFFECGLLWFLSVFYILYIVRVDAPVPGRKSLLFYLKLVCSLLLVVVCVVDVIKGVLSFMSGTNDRYSAVFVSPLVHLLTFLLVIVIINLERWKAFVTSGVLFLFLFVSVAIGILPLYSFSYHISKGVGVDIFAMALYVVYFVLCLAALILFCFADKQQVLLIPNHDKVCPEVKSSFLSRITYWWVNKLVWSGYKKPLVETDLWHPTAADLSLKTGSDLERSWKHELDRCHWINLEKRAAEMPRRSLMWSADVDRDGPSTSATPLLNGSVGNTEEADKVDVRYSSPICRKQPSLLLAIFRVFGPTLAQAHACKLVGDVMIFCGPLLQSVLVEYTVDPSVEAWKGYMYAALLLASSVMNSFMLQMLYQISSKVGMRVKAAIISMVYKKALTMSNEARRTTTVGEIVNLMAVDAERLRDVSAYLWMVWSCPLQIVAACVLLYNVLGVSIFAGLGVMLVLFPVNLILARIQSKLETKLMQLKDQRMKLMNEVLSGIKVIKLYAWELSFEEKVKEIRKLELSALKKYSYISAIGTFTWTCAPFLVTLATFTMYIMLGGVLDANRAFTSLSLFNILRFPMSVLPMMMAYVVTAGVSVNRLNRFLQAIDMDASVVTRDDSDNADAVVIDNGTFAWGTGKDDSPILKNINLHVPDGKLVAVVGPVGVGKSSLISALLGEMEKLVGHVAVKGSVAYVAQQAWIQNLSLRDNILFGSPYDEQRYNTVISACALKPDLEILPAGDMTEIGENGINLSGGQKQRVSLARAVYQDRSLYLFDDPLSAVDSHVGRHLFDQVIGNNGLLANKTRILVTHGIHWLPMVDVVVVMQDGQLSEVGSYQLLLSRDKAFARFLKTYLTQPAEEDDPEIVKIRSEMMIRVNSLVDDDVESEQQPTVVWTESVATKTESTTRMRPRKSTSNTSQIERKLSQELRDVTTSKCNNRLTEDEGGEVGAVKWSVYVAYCRALGLVMFAFLLLAFALFETSSLLSSLWLTKWTEDPLLQNATLVNTTIYVYYRDFYLGVYGGLGFLQAIFVLCYALLNASRSVAASAKLHNTMLSSILRSTLVFFETTPMGRVMNRFSRDIETVDKILPDLFESFMVSAFNVLATIVILCYAVPWFIIVAVPLAVIYYFAQRFYVPTSRQLRRLESKTRSPIYVHFSETISGASTIRAFAVQSKFIDTSNKGVDSNLVFFYANISANRWLGFRLEFIAAVVVFSAAIFAVVGRGTISGSIVGLAISYSLQVTDSLNWLVRMTSDLETNMVSVERLKEYIETPSEAEWYIEDTSPPDNWPSAGAISFAQYATRYRSCLDLVLRDINLFVKSGEKVGIVGRTGAGKSSLTLAIFRILEATAGEIVIDNVHIAALGLHQLRSRITILPQDPVLFSGTVRMNLDPFSRYTDDLLWRALEHAHLKTFIQSLPSALEHECGEGGRNFSVGQRQLMCLARALLRKTSILVLDEATAAVDVETDELIQTTIRQEFAECTVLTIAHRLNTILDCDRVVVLDAGKVCEFDSPKSLLGNCDSRFFAMAKDAGLV